MPISLTRSLATRRFPSFLFFAFEKLLEYFTSSEFHTPFPLSPSEYFNPIIKKCVIPKVLSESIVISIVEMQVDVISSATSIPTIRLPIILRKAFIFFNILSSEKIMQMAIVIITICGLIR